jgi:DUF917 family protein
LVTGREKKLAGIIPNENGAGFGVNGWIQAAALNLPMVDAPANGRAHPTGLMGAMGLHRQINYHSIQSAVGGNPDLDLYLEMTCQGIVKQLWLETVGGYDIGRVVLEGDRAAELTFWNEFMTLGMDGNGQATFPELITLLSLETGLPISSAELTEDQQVAVLTAPQESLILGKGVLLPETLAEAEKAIGKQLVDL